MEALRGNFQGNTSYCSIYELYICSIDELL